MGEIVVKVKLENVIDRALQQLGQLEAAKVRAITVDALVDTGAVMLVVPEDVVHKLGINETSTAIVRYANEDAEERPIAGPIEIAIGDRSMITECLVGPPLSEPLIGQIVLERLDLLADCTHRRLTPRPESPHYPLLKVK